MARCLVLTRANTNTKTQTLNPNSNPFLSLFFTSPSSTSFLITKTPKKFKKKCKQNKKSPRIKHVQSNLNLIPHFERIIERNFYFQFDTKSKTFLSSQPEHILRLDDANKLHH